MMPPLEEGAAQWLAFRIFTLELGPGGRRHVIRPVLFREWLVWAGPPSRRMTSNSGLLLE
ncbi:hypothetical protein [Melittangium boletus]|uniref:hypothetical protein n=1 Tax=Melittangium boletus TaxID=83453 RepID=UPI003DA42847